MRRSKTPIALAVGIAIVLAATEAATPRTPVARVVKTISVPGQGAIAVGGGAVWATANSGWLYRISPKSNAIVARIALRTRSPQFCCTFAFGAVWLSDADADTLLRISVRTNEVVSRIPVGRAPVGTTASFGSVWVANNADGSVMRIDPGSNRVVATIRVGAPGSQRPYGNGPLSLTTAGGSVWATVPNANALVRIDPATNSVVATVRTHRQCVAVGRRASVYVAAACGGPTISRISTRTNRVATRVRLREVPGPPVVRGRYLWAVTFDGGIVKLDATNLDLAGRVELRGFDFEGESLAASPDALWVRANGAVVRLAPR